MSQMKRLEVTADSPNIQNGGHRLKVKTSASRSRTRHGVVTRLGMEVVSAITSAPYGRDLVVGDN